MNVLQLFSHFFPCFMGALVIEELFVLPHDTNAPGMNAFYQFSEENICRLLMIFAALIFLMCCLLYV